MSQKDLQLNVEVDFKVDGRQLAEQTIIAYNRAKVYGAGYLMVTADGSVTALDNSKVEIRYYPEDTSERDHKFNELKIKLSEAAEAGAIAGQERLKEDLRRDTHVGPQGGLLGAICGGAK
ncbi:hypothetical protein [Hafnia phage yong3]|nr:hypothetical protein [Hafnia phage yong3]